MNIKDLTFEDIPIVCDIHIKSFPMSIFSQLGKSAVEKYYEWLLYGPHESLNIGIYTDAKLIGYCFGGKFNGALSGYVKRNKVFLLIKVLSKPHLVFSINFMSKLMVLIKDNLPEYLKKRQKKKPDYGYNISFAILAIAIHPESRAKGVGKMLMDYSEQYAGTKLYNSMHLSVNRANEVAINFYVKCGWNILSSTKKNINMIKRL
ncbi:MAG: GNAT family N-acetyltransferase [Pelagibacterales bacterium]|nr:GNAT family N-acetyltransferase [Pelagibacterales bacterium]